MFRIENIFIILENIFANQNKSITFALRNKTIAMKEQTYYTVEYLDEIGAAFAEEENQTEEQVEHIKKQAKEHKYEIRVIKQSYRY